MNRNQKKAPDWNYSMPSLGCALPQCHHGLTLKNTHTSPVLLVFLKSSSPGNLDSVLLAHILFRITISSSYKELDFSNSMSEDWDSVTKIGSKTRGNTQRATVARTQSEINAARRSGAVVATEKKV